MSKKDMVIDGFEVTQEDIDHLDPLRQVVAHELIRQGRWKLKPTNGGDQHEQ